MLTPDNSSVLHPLLLSCTEMVNSIIFKQELLLLTKNGEIHECLSYEFYLVIPLCY